MVAIVDAGGNVAVDDCPCIFGRGQSNHAAIPVRGEDFCVAGASEPKLEDVTLAAVKTY